MKKTYMKHESKTKEMLPGASLNITLFQHKTPESIQGAYLYFGGPAEDFKVLTREELREIEEGGTDQDGKEHWFTAEDVLNAMIETGYWGFSDNMNHVVHIWHDGKQDTLEEVKHVLAHEISHQVLDFLKGKGVLAAVLTDEMLIELGHVKREQSPIPPEEFAVDLMAWGSCLAMEWFVLLEESEV